MTEALAKPEAEAVIVMRPRGAFALSMATLTKRGLKRVEVNASYNEF